MRFTFRVVRSIYGIQFVVHNLGKWGCRDAVEPPASCVVLTGTHTSNGEICMVENGVEPELSEDSDRVNVLSCKESRGEPSLVAYTKREL